MNELLNKKAVLLAADKLQIGVARLEFLDKRALRYFLDKSWVHLGDAPHCEDRWRRWTGKLRTYGLLQCAKDAVGMLLKRWQCPSVQNNGIEDLYTKTNFISFYYRKGDRLLLEDETFNFVFSEHVFEHFFLDDVIDLLKETHRVMRPNGVIRVVVPDADLRPHPEPLPPKNLSLTHPLRHKIRWNVYALATILECAGFEAVPLRYYDKEGKFWDVDWPRIQEKYKHSQAGEILFHLSYVQRPDSLIVDGFKK
ncbi:MAG: methyltransferase domain-containing protein [Verrucomicrobiota bacterium]